MCVHLQCLISVGDVLLALYAALPTLIFARGICFIKEDIKIVLANLESFLNFINHSSLYIERMREREDKARDREIER